MRNTVGCRVRNERKWGNWVTKAAVFMSQAVWGIHTVHLFLPTDLHFSQPKKRAGWGHCCCQHLWENFLCLHMSVALCICLYVVQETFVHVPQEYALSLTAAWIWRYTDEAALPPLVYWNLQPLTYMFWLPLSKYICISRDNEKKAKEIKYSQFY